MNKLDVAVQAYRCALEKSFAAPNALFEGTFDANGYAELVLSLTSVNIDFNGNDEDKTLSFSTPFVDNGYFTENIGKLIERKKYCIKLPRRFYLTEQDYLYEDSESSDELDIEAKRYFDTVSFANVLLGLVDYPIPSSQKAIFFHGGKYELAFEYAANDLKPLDGLSDLKHFVQEDIHKEQRVAIIKSVLAEMADSQEGRTLKMPYLIENFDEFFGKIKANYDMYVSEFSFKKIKKQVESEIFDFTVKLNKVFSDIQNQLLVVPFALILAGSQMRPSDGISLQNSIILIAILVFCIFMHLLLQNQHNTLNAIKLEFNSQRGTISTKHALASGKLGVLYTGLEDRQKTQRNVLCFIEATLLVILLLSVFIFVYHSHFFDFDILSNLDQETVVSGMVWQAIFYMMAVLINHADQLFF